MLTLGQLQLNKLPYSILRRSVDICGVDFNKLYNHLNSLDNNGEDYSLIGINNIWLKLNECTLYCSPLIDVEILNNKIYLDFDVTYDGEYMGGKRVSNISYEQMYIYINRLYSGYISDLDINKFITYNNRNMILDSISWELK